jgi:hypothetical protein
MPISSFRFPFTKAKVTKIYFPDNVTGGSFSPSDLPNLVLWLKADAGVEEADGDPAEDTDTVLNWLDQSGSSNHAIQSTSGSRPTYRTNILNSNPVLRFDGSADFMDGTTISNIHTSSISIFVVASSNGFSASEERGLFAVGGFANGLWVEIESYNRTFSIFNNNVLLTGTTDALDTAGGFTAKVFSAVKTTGTSWFTYIDGVQNSTSTNATLCGNFTNTVYTVGETEFTHSGDIAEIIVYLDAKNTSDRQLVESYLTTKYAL